MTILLPLLVGFVAGVMAWLLMPRVTGFYGFVVTTILGIVASLASALFGEAAGLYQAGNSARISGSAFGAALVLLVWAGFTGGGAEIE